MTSLYISSGSTGAGTSTAGDQSVHFVRFYPRWHEYELQQTERLQYRLDEEQLRHDWLQLLSLGKPGMPLEQLHIWTLAHIVRRPVIVYGVKYVKSFRGEPLGYARFEGQWPSLFERYSCSWY